MDVRYVAKLFKYEHLPPHLQAVSKPFHDLALRVLEQPMNPERTISLRKLLEAKDAAVRCAVIGDLTE